MVRPRTEWGTGLARVFLPSPQERTDGIFHDMRAASHHTETRTITHDHTHGAHDPTRLHENTQRRTWGLTRSSTVRLLSVCSGASGSSSPSCWCCPSVSSSPHTMHGFDCAEPIVVLHELRKTTFTSPFVRTFLTCFEGAPTGAPLSFPPHRTSNVRVRVNVGHREKPLSSPARHRVRAPCAFLTL